MPTYQYVCTDCGDGLEVVQKFSDDPLTTHDACGGKLRKVFSPVGIVFKGSGFYRTDSRNGSSSATAPSGTSSSAADKTDKSDKTEKSATPAKSESSATSTPAATGSSGSSSKVALSPAAPAS